MFRFPRHSAAMVGLIALSDALMCGALVVKAQLTAPQSVEWLDPVDALVVFYDQPGRFQRVETAVEALRAGHARHILMVGGCRPKAGWSGAREMADFAVRAGALPSQVHVGPGSYHTRSNLEETLTVARDKGWVSVAFVSDPLHLVRIMKSSGSDMALASLSDGRSLASAYSGGLLDIAARAHHEIVYMALSALLPEPKLERLIRVLRNQADEDDLTACVQGFPQ